MTLSVSALALAAMMTMNAANGPAYNPSTAAAISGTVTAVKVIPAGQPLEGVHVTVKTKNNSEEVYLAPKQFMNFLKTSYVPGDQIAVTGSRVKNGTADVILAREVSDGVDTIELRDLYGAPVWENWGVEADPAAVRY
jgi:hypothetical protein